MIWTKNEYIVLPITFLIIVILSLLILFFLKNKSEKIKLIPLKIITITMLVLECIKQVKNIREGYSLWTIPLHFCSLFLYFYPLAVFAKGKVQEFGKTMSLVSSLLMTVMFYLNPSSIIGDSSSNIFASFANIHTFIYHHLVILFLLTSLLLNVYKYNKRNYLYTVIGFVLYAVIAIPAAHALQVNFCNILVSNIPFMETFRLNVGQLLYTIVLFMFGISSGLVVVLLQFLLSKLKRRKV